jgi:Uma2 family endonuclease
MAIPAEAPAEGPEIGLLPAELAEQMPNARLLLSDEPQMESTDHWEQLALLMAILKWAWRGRTDYFVGANLSIYYDRSDLTRRRFCGPDLFLVNGVEPAKRNSWVVWEEGGRYPDLIIELLSNRTAQTDRTDKKRLYQNVFRTPEYFWFHPQTLEFAGFRLQSGNRYEPIPSDYQDRRWSEALQMHLGVQDHRLRLFGPDGALLPTPEESAEAACGQAATALASAAAEHARAEALAAKLRELGLDPDGLS